MKDKTKNRMFPKTKELTGIRKNGSRSFDEFDFFTDAEKWLAS